MNTLSIDEQEKIQQFQDIVSTYKVSRVTANLNHSLHESVRDVFVNAIKLFHNLKKVNVWTDARKSNKPGNIAGMQIKAEVVYWNNMTIRQKQTVLDNLKQYNCTVVQRDDRYVAVERIV